MDPTNTESKTKSRDSENEKHRLKDMHRVVISKEAKLALENLLKRANEGFDAGEITKSDIVNTLLLNATKYFTDAEIKNLRSQHFNEGKALETLQKELAQGKALPENVKAFLRNQYGLAETAKRRSSSQPAAKSESTLSLIEGEDGAR